MIRTTAALVMLAVVAAGCTSSDDEDARPAGPDPSTCELVRSGIDAFNEGDYVTTQAEFRKALPLADDAAEADPSQQASDLLEAVKYYADLAPDDYPESARSSEEFEKYKQITLGQCVAPVEEAEQSPGTEV